MMSKSGYTQKYLRKRKMLLIMPILFIPFITMAFWAMGGGKTKDSVLVSAKGFNLNLPNPNIKEDKSADKLSFYNQAERDSLKMLELMRNDPYYHRSSIALQSPSELGRIGENAATHHSQRLNTSLYEGNANNPEEKLMERLNSLQAELDKPNHQESAGKSVNVETTNGTTDPDLEKLESMIQAISNSGSVDPELTKLDKTLDKILDIQHPDRVKEKVKESTTIISQKQVSTVSKPSSASISLLTSEPGNDSANKFFSDELSEQRFVSGESIEAVIHENQTLNNGSIVKLRMIADAEVDGVNIPKGNFLFGIAQFNDERINVEINFIRYKNRLFNVSLKMFGFDGLPGIYVPGAISRDVIKNSADNSLQLFELSAMDPSFKAQAATAGINTVKSLLSKKVKQTKVQVKAGYRVLLINMKSNY